LLVLWLLHLETASDVSTAAILAAIGCAAGVIVFGGVLFSRGWIGGGDVKLLAAAALWAGAGAFPPLLLLTGLIGGLLALFFLTPLGARITAARDPRPERVSADNPRMRGTPLPYGVAIAAAGLLVTLSPYLG
jgi:prepilin peptidase CpaA